MVQAFTEFDTMSKDQLEVNLSQLDYEIENNKSVIFNESQKKKKYKIDNQRRQHSYIPLIYEMLKTFAEKNVLNNMFQEEVKKKADKTKK